MSNRVHGIMILVRAGPALPNQASDPEKGAASNAPRDSDTTMTGNPVTHTIP